MLVAQNELHKHNKIGDIPGTSFTHKMAEISILKTANNVLLL